MHLKLDNIASISSCMESVRDHLFLFREYYLDTTKSPHDVITHRDLAFCNQKQDDEHRSVKVCCDIPSNSACKQWRNKTLDLLL